MAYAALLGGAVGIRANTVVDIAESAIEAAIRPIFVLRSKLVIFLITYAKRIGFAVSKKKKIYFKQFL